jgi:hypothetical protein
MSDTTIPEEPNRKAFIKTYQEYPFDHMLSRYFSKEIASVLYRHEILEIYDFLEKLLHKAPHEEELE